MAHRDRLVGFYLLLTIWLYIDKNCENVSLWPRNFILDNGEENIPMQEVIWTGTWWVMMPTRENPEVSWGAGSKCGNHINKVEVLFCPATYYFMIISYVALRRILRGTIYVLPPSLHSLGEQALTTLTTLPDVASLPITWKLIKRRLWAGYLRYIISSLPWMVLGAAGPETKLKGKREVKELTLHHNAYQRWRRTLDTSSVLSFLNCNGVPTLVIRN